MGEDRSGCRWGEIYSKTTSLVFVGHGLQVKYFIFLFLKSSTEAGISVGYPANTVCLTLLQGGCQSWVLVSPITQC